MKIYKFCLLLIVLISFGFSQNSIITIKGTGTAGTSAHITIGTDGYKCPNEYIVEGGASLTTWDTSAICSAIIANQTISGFVKDKNNTGVKNVSIVFSNGGQTVNTDATGYYSTAVPFGWSGTSTPSKVGYTFVPPNYTYTNVNADQTDQDFVANPKYVIIYGSIKYSNNVPVEGVVVAFSNSGLTATTDADGYYERFITEGWSGTATPTKTDHSFDPISYSYTAILTNQNDQDYIATRSSLEISGHIRDGDNNGIEGFEVVFSNGGATVTTNATGHYSTSVAYGWNGTATPTKDGWTCTPSSYTYPAVTTNQSNQDYVGTYLTLDTEDVQELPEEFSLEPNYPNPFNPTTSIRYNLPETTQVRIVLYDILGQEVRTLINGTKEPGYHSVVWDATDNNGKPVSGGIYIYSIQSNKFNANRKMILLK